MSKKNIIIASKNPVKINAVGLAFQKIFPDQSFNFQGISVPSGVSDQPIDNQETFTGASNRANQAKKDCPAADYWVGIEGGVQKVNDEMEVFAWIVIQSNHLTGKARTGTFFLPKKIVELIDQGIELGEADDIVFGQSNSKQKSGSVGILTGDIIDRTKYYVDAIVLALIPFKNNHLIF